MTGSPCSTRSAPARRLRRARLGRADDLRRGHARARALTRHRHDRDPHPSLLQRTPASLFAARHFLELKLPWAARSVKRNDFAYLDKLYRRWAPNWSGPEREACLREIKQALSTDATLNGAIDYYRALPLGGSRLLDKPPVVANLAVAGTADLVDVELYKSTSEIFPAPSRALIVDGAGHWPHREEPALVLPEIVSFVAAL